MWERQVTLQEYMDMRADTNGWREVIPHLTNEALEYAVKHNMENCWTFRKHEKDAPVYESTFIHFYVPELLERLRRLEHLERVLNTPVPPEMLGIIKGLVSAQQYRLAESLINGAQAVMKAHAKT